MPEIQNRNRLNGSQKKEVIKFWMRNKKMPHNEIATYFSRLFSIQIARRTIGDIIANKEKWLNSCKIFDNSTTCRPPKHPELEEALYIWFIQKREQNAILNQEILIGKAKEFSNKLGITAFNFSNGWLEKFKKRNRIKSYVLHGESGSVNKQSLNDCLMAVKAKICNYDDDNVFNMDETALFYDYRGDRSLSINSLTEGTKQSKTRITIALCTNASGSEKRKMIIIGKAKKPRAFKSLDVSSYCDYQHNKKGWMTSDIFKNWIFKFDKEMGNQDRKIALILDNATSHTNISESLKNIELIFLYPNLTPYIQPMDQGIIKNFKSHYKSMLLKKTIECLDRKIEYKIQMDDAIKWSHAAWQKVSVDAIVNCWRKSALLDSDTNDMIIPTESKNYDLLNDNLELLYANLALRLGPENVTSFDNFIKLDENEITSNYLHDNEIIDIIQDKMQKPDEAEDLFTVEEVKKISNREAEDAVKTIALFINQTGECNPELSNSLQLLTDFIEKHSFKKQTTLDIFLNKC